MFAANLRRGGDALRRRAITPIGKICRLLAELEFADDAGHRWSASHVSILRSSPFARPAAARLEA